MHLQQVHYALCTSLAHTIRSSSQRMSAERPGLSVPSCKVDKETVRHWAVMGITDVTTWHSSWQKDRSQAVAAMVITVTDAWPW